MPPSTPRFDRLTLRLTVWIIVLVLVPVALGLSLLFRYQYDRFIAAQRETAEFEIRILEAALRHQMLDKDPGLMTQVLTDIGEHPGVHRAMVIDHEGVIRLSNRPGDLGVEVPQNSPTCLVCHARSPEDRQRWVLLEEDGSNLLRSVLPIENRVQCHACHDPQVRYNGMLILDVSLAALHADLRNDAVTMATGTAVLTLVLIAGAGLLVRRLILVRLSRLSATARAIAGGALETRAEVDGDDVITSLARDFNNMADATSRLIDEIRSRENQMAGILNSLDDGMVVLDKDFRIVAANHSLAQRLCRRSGNLQGEVCRDVVGHTLPCHDDHDCPAARCLQTSRTQRGIYRTGGDNEDEQRVFEVYASPVAGERGDVEQVVELWRDITERVRDEERLAEIEHLSSLGVLASGLSHEVNTPLATTLTCAEGILGRLPEEAVGADEERRAIRESAGIIRDQVLRCRKITEHFLRFSRRIPPSVELINLVEVVRSVIVLASPTARGRGIEVRLNCTDGVPLVRANTELVQHVVLNVLVNAIESCGEKGGLVELDFVVDDVVRLHIRDDGCGIRDDVRRHIFEPFRSEKPRGTGLGLFLSRTFMRRFGGDVRLVSSRVGAGSCVAIEFPRTGAEQDG
jgi:PAS domain S-box-containing protein